MFERLKSILHTALGDAVAEPRAPEQLVATAAAMLLLEIAWSDQDIVEEELESTRRALEEIFDLGAKQAAAIVTAARREHGRSISMYPHTRAVNDALTPDEKQTLLIACWRLALADTRIDRHEEYTIRRIADLLHLSHDDFIAAKLAAKADG